jgi:hypothetical protein
MSLLVHCSEQSSAALFAHYGPAAFYRETLNTAAGHNNKAMIRYAQILSTVLRSLSLWTLVASLALTWQESCENPPLFCYRVGRRIFMRDAA